MGVLALANARMQGRFRGKTGGRTAVDEALGVSSMESLSKSVFFQQARLVTPLTPILWPLFQTSIHRADVKSPQQEAG